MLRGILQVFGLCALFVPKAVDVEAYLEAASVESAWKEVGEHLSAAIGAYEEVESD